nr:(+)-neomenthol dehydrogenase [Ipomoea batatas]
MALACTNSIEWDFLALEPENMGQLAQDYAVSKLALNAYSKVLARRYRGRGLSVNCFCPGFTQTSMTCGKGKHTPEAAAEIEAKLALLPADQLPSGIFFASSTTSASTFSKL